MATQFTTNGTQTTSIQQETLDIILPLLLLKQSGTGTVTLQAVTFAGTEPDPATDNVLTQVLYGETFYYRIQIENTKTDDPREPINNITITLTESTSATFPATITLDDNAFLDGVTPSNTASFIKTNNVLTITDTDNATTNGLTVAAPTTSGTPVSGYIYIQATVVAAP